MSGIVQRRARAPSIPGYRDLSLVGEGATSLVFRAVEESSGAVVALKLLRRGLRTDPVSVERFRRETKILRMLNDEHVVAVFDLLESEAGIALVMELVDGCTLKELIWREAPLDARRVQGVVRQLLSVLARCHRSGVVHRDLKPQNVLVETGDRAKLVDFGIARLSTFGELTRTGAALGSPEYMAPELFAAAGFEPRADLYAVGVIAFEMLTGKLPYRADTVARLYTAHRHDPIPVPSATVPSLPRWMDDFVERLLAKDPFDRYQTAEEALEDLARERVSSSGLYALARRECVSCGERTLEDLLICAFCGYHHLETFLPGDFEVHLSPDADEAKLERFLQRVGARAPGSAGNDVLVRRVDETSAVLLKESLRRHGLYATVARPSLPSRIGPALLGLVSVATGVVLVDSLFPWLLDPSSPTSFDRSLRELVPDLLALGLLLLLLVRAARMFHRRERGPEVLRTIEETLDREFGWMGELVPFLVRIGGGDMRRASARLIEKYFVLRERSPELLGEISERIEVVLSRAVELAGYLSEIDRLLGRLDVSRGRGPSAARAIADLEDRRSMLDRQLARTASLFNRLVADAVDSNEAAISDTAERLDEARNALEREIVVGREVRHELEAFA